MAAAKRKPVPVRASPTSVAVQARKPAVAGSGGNGSGGNGSGGNGKPTARTPAAATAAQTPASAGWIAPAWLQFTTFALAIAGLGVSIYLTYEHFTGGALAGCKETSGAINCTKVTTSHQSFLYLPGWTIPVAVLGLAFYVAVVPLMSPWAWRMKNPLVHYVRLAAMISGIAFVLWLIYAELFKIQAICLYCTSVHILTFLIFALTVAAATLWGLKPETADT